MNVTGSNTDAAATLGIFAGSRGHDAGAVRANEAGSGIFHGRSDFHHVHDRDSLGDSHNKIDSRIDCFKDRVTRERRRHEDRAHRCAGLSNRVSDCVEDRNSICKFLTALTGCHSGNQLSSIIEAELRVSAAKGTGNTLN